MDSWLREVVELHEAFEAYFLGTSDSLDRVDQALADDFTIVGPDGAESNRKETMAQIAAGHTQTTALEISITNGQLVFETNEFVVARYVENHKLRDRTTHRLATVVFSNDHDAPNGLVWRRVHETWLVS